jgi:hypothetical protein
MKKFWKFMSGVQATVWLILTAIVLLLTGSFYVKTNKMGFNLLDHSLMQDWFREWGFRYLMMGFATMTHRAGMRGLNERKMGIGKLT